MKIIILIMSVLFANGLLFVNIYNSIVDARSWGSNIPHSISIAREYSKSFSPGTFFKMIAPFNQVLSFLSPVIFWNSPEIRLYSGIAFIVYILTDVFTFIYFYPRNDIMFKTGLLTDIEKLTKAHRQWSIMNWYRSLLVCVGLIFSLISLHIAYLG